MGRIVEILPHPGGDLIWLARVDIGADYQPRIVWGGVPVVTEGSLVPVAQPGTWLPATKDKPGPYKIRRRRYRGEVSEGMLCSLAELGWDSSVTDRVALLKDSAGLRVGESLNNRFVDWARIAVLSRTTRMCRSRTTQSVANHLTEPISPRQTSVQDRTRRAIASDASLTLSPACGPPSSMAWATQWPR